MNTFPALLLASACALFALEGRAFAEAPSWLRSENKRVREGNEKMAAGDPKSALAAYDQAARELPSEGGVHLDRGLALLKSGDTAKAREALRLSTQPPASPEVRAAGYYNLGIAFYKEADKSAGAEQHQEAQNGFRDAVDAFKQSLRLHPGDKNAAWNYELAKRRAQEQEQKQKEKQEQQKQDQQQQDQQQQQQNQDQQQQDQQNQDQQQQDQQQQSQDQQQQQQQQQQDQQKADQQQPQPQPSQDGQQEPAQARPEMERALDALQEGEDNLEKMRAMQRAARERRKPEKDW